MASPVTQQPSLYFSWCCPCNRIAVPSSLVGSAAAAASDKVCDISGLGTLPKQNDLEGIRQRHLVAASPTPATAPLLEEASSLTSAPPEVLGEVSLQPHVKLTPDQLSPAALKEVAQFFNEIAAIFTSKRNSVVAAASAVAPNAVLLAIHLGPGSNPDFNSDILKRLTGKDDWKDVSYDTMHTLSCDLYKSYMPKLDEKAITEVDYSAFENARTLDIQAFIDLEKNSPFLINAASLAEKPFTVSKIKTTMKHGRLLFCAFLLATWTCKDKDDPRAEFEKFKAIVSDITPAENTPDKCKEFNVALFRRLIEKTRGYTRPSFSHPKGNYSP
jgi:hypothetical protein